jgi:hypothetical protein
VIQSCADRLVGLRRGADREEKKLVDVSDFGGAAQHQEKGARQRRSAREYHVG